MAPEKIAKSDAPMTLTLERTRDILADLGRGRARRGAGAPLLVGFAAETSDAVARAREKRIHKNVDIIVANDVSRSDAGFDVDTNAVTIVGPGGEEAVPLSSKPAVAAVILDRVERLLRGRAATAPARA
jgi:phosphopantothenoylcysteine decarboxylase/phosphopantothenate--cysteine ligase